MEKSARSRLLLLRVLVLSIIFLSLTCLLFLGLRSDSDLTTTAQQIVFPLGMGGLLSGLIVLFLVALTEDAPQARPRRWQYPLTAGLLGLACMALAYAYLGVWPVGERSVMIVDMHHQYAPLLAKFREMLLHGGSPFYSFEVGLGSSFLPLFGYYLASPFNLLLTLFPESCLNEGILVITLLKNALSAFFFALCVQYIYRRRDLTVVLSSLLYSLMLYLIAYSWNIMWLDCVMVLPLAVMFFERLMRTGKYLGYILTLAYILYANYYIGFMVCLFLTLYFLAYLLRKRRTALEAGLAFGRFAAGSLLGGGLVMALLIPIYLSLAHTSAAGGTLPAMNNNFDMFDLLGRHLYASSPTIRSGNLPNIYCGILPVLLLPLFLTMKSIPLRRRLTCFGLLGVLGISFVLNQFDLVWHGLHAPNDLPYRFSFLYSFVLILIAFDTLPRLREVTLRQLGGVTGALVLWIMVQEKLAGKDLGFDPVYISLLLVLIYAAIVALVSARRLETRPAQALLLLIVTAEMTFNAGASFQAMQSKEYFTARADYVANDTTEAIRKGIAQLKETGDRAAKGSFYRMEFLPRRTTVDTALFNYRGITVFASSNRESVTKFMGYLGYPVNGVNSHLYKSYVPAVDALFGIRYLMLDSSTASEIGDNAYLSALGSVSSGSVEYSLYENRLALPLGYLVGSGVNSWTPSKYNPIASQESFFSSLTGKDVTLYDPAVTTANSYGGGTAAMNGSTNFSITASGDSAGGTFTSTVSRTGQVYVFVDCRAAKSIEVSSDTGSWSVTPYEPYIINAGTMKQGDTVTVTVSSKSSCDGNIYVETLRESNLESAISTLSSTPLKVTRFTDDRVEGTVQAASGGILLTSIPYDEGWTVRVDGEKVSTQAAADAMLSFPVSAGEHTVEITFFPPGLIPGAIISILSLLVLIAWLRFIRRPFAPEATRKSEFSRLFSLLTPRESADAGEASSESISLSEIASAENISGEVASDDYHSDAGL